MFYEKQKNMKNEILILSMICQTIFAQKAMVSAGNTHVGSLGSFSYTFGQQEYSFSSISGTGSFKAGVQQPYLNIDMPKINLPQTILGLNPISNKTYGDSPIILGIITATSGLPVSVSVVSNPPTNVVSFLNNQINILGGGTVTVTAVQLGSPPTYLPASSVTQIFSVSKAILTVSGLNAQRKFGEANPNLQYIISGLLNQDILSSIDVAPTASSPATLASDVGTYPINVAGGNDNAYDYQYIGATLSITRATNTFTILPKAITLSVGDTITIGAEAESKLPLNLTLDNSTIATLIGNKIIGKNAGTGLVSANQSQSLNYDSLSTKTIPVTVNAAPSRDFGIIGSNKVPVGIVVIYTQPSVPGYTYSWTIIGSGFQIVPGTENTPNLQVIFSENATPAEVNSVVKDQDQNVVSNTRLAVNPLGSDEAKLVRDLQKVDCPPEVTDCKNAYITDVAFGKLKNLGTGCSRAGYGDFTVGLKLDSLLMGDSYDLSLGSVAEAGKSSFFAVWIDYNNNGKFTDQDDFLAASFENASKFEIKNIIIKNQTEYEGPRRMRVSMRADAVISPTDPCAKTGGSGETEDYLVFIRKPDELQACSFISPNKDGKNDNFIIRGINPKESNKLIVMDRYGSLVYEKENYANDWDGKNSKNNELTEGTYYYQFINGENEIKGFVEVKRK
ncbi:MAG: gliding motility-associated C-terminal domain-containing protein [Bacteroidetes bacterium]|nr:MAG: gliding motility-associated C-terminal domain-containing protein [Bacteroidota bacterium]